MTRLQTVPATMLFHSICAGLSINLFSMFHDTEIDQTSFHLCTIG